ncbi:MAG: hypothetical protein LCH32_10700 [Bacteroidetes bacterium]|nr:hypothetical protein [Bacteroidota bacterium]
MKKIVIILSIVLVNFAKASNNNMLAVKPTTLVTKTNAGLFGYKVVTDGTTQNGNYWLNCANPGFHKCTPSAISIPGGDVSITFLKTIDELVNERITENSTKGILLYQDYTVKYKYVVGNDKIVYKIYAQEDFNTVSANEELED